MKDLGLGPVQNFYQDILPRLVLPQIQRTIAEVGRQGMTVDDLEDLHAAYCSLAEVDVPLEAFKAWCSLLKVGLKTSLTLGGRIATLPDPEDLPGFDEESPVGAPSGGPSGKQSVVMGIGSSAFNAPPDQTSIPLHKLHQQRLMQRPRPVRYAEGIAPGFGGVIEESD